MGNRNLNNLRNFAYILFSLFIILCSAVFGAYAESQGKSTSDIIGNILKSAKLKEEIYLSGVTLEEMIGDAPRLEGLKEISLMTYRLDKPCTEEEAMALSNAYKDLLIPQDWQPILIHNDEDNKMVLIYGKEKDGVREKLLTVILMPAELSEMILTGAVGLSALEELRRVILESIPRFEEAQPLANFFSGGQRPVRVTSPSQDDTKHPAYRTLMEARELFKEGRNSEALRKYLDVVYRYKAEAKEWWQMEAYLGAAKTSKKLGDIEMEKVCYKTALIRFGHIDSPELTEAQKNLLIMERGGPLPFLGLGFRHTGSIDGAYIVTVFKNGPCAEAGIQRSDILIAIDSEPTPNPRSVINIIGRKNVGDTITLKVKRGVEEILAKVTLVEMPATLERL